MANKQTECEYKILKNQVDLMVAITLLLEKAAMDSPKLYRFIDESVKVLKKDAESTAKLFD